MAGSDLEKLRADIALTREKVVDLRLSLPAGDALLAESDDALARIRAEEEAEDRALAERVQRREQHIALLDEQVCQALLKESMLLRRKQRHEKAMAGASEVRKARESCVVRQEERCRRRLPVFRMP